MAPPKVSPADGNGGLTWKIVQLTTANASEIKPFHVEVRSRQVSHRFDLFSLRGALAARLSFDERPRL